MKTISQPGQASSVGNCAIWRAASTPVMPGMRMSRKTRSGCSCAVISTASTPLLASPTISSSGQTSARRARNCSRIRRSSSAISARRFIGGAASGLDVFMASMVSARQVPRRRGAASAATATTSSSGSSERRQRQRADAEQTRRRPAARRRHQQQGQREPQHQRHHQDDDAQREQQAETASRGMPADSGARCSSWSLTITCTPSAGTPKANQQRRATRRQPSSESNNSASSKTSS